MRNQTTALVLIATLASVAEARPQGCPNPAQGPDLIVGDVGGINFYGTVGGISAYSYQLTSCNLGDTNVLWEANTERHPISTQNLYRIEDGRLEQLGLAWVRHQVAALASAACCTCVPPGTVTRLGAGCSTTSSAGLMGSQQLLGPRSEVDPFSGALVFPYNTQGQTGDAIYKRLQVASVELDPAAHGAASYFIQSLHVSADDSAANNASNNSSWRNVRVGAPSAGGWQLVAEGMTTREATPIDAWAALDPTVVVSAVQVPGEGRFVVGSRAEDNGDGTWTYAYAVYNLSSTRALKSFSVPVDPGTPVSEPRFTDVDYHSGETYSGADWALAAGADSVDWSTDPFATDPDANALRWDTTYSFGFRAPGAPALASATLGMFLPGSPGEISADVMAPVGGGPSSYCVGAPNSAGSGAALGFSGGVGVAANDFTLLSSGAIPAGAGLFFYGANAVSVPFGDGLRCVGGSTFRLFPPVTADAQGTARRTLDFDAPPANGGAGAVIPGSTWRFQHWYRDTPAGASGFNLSDGLRVTFGV